MSWRDAPLYIETYDLAAWVLERCACWRDGPSRLLSERIADSAANLVIGAALALTFPSTRSQHLAQLDQEIVRLRIALRLVERLGGLSARQLRFAADRLTAVGRMVGGWRKRVDRSMKRAGRQRAERAAKPTDPQILGEEPPPAGV